MLPPRPDCRRGHGVAPAEHSQRPPQSARAPEAPPRLPGSCESHARVGLSGQLAFPERPERGPLLALLPRSCSPPGRLRAALLLIRPYSALAGRPGGVHWLVSLPPRVSSLPAPAVRGRAPPDLPPCPAPVCRQGHRGASLACPPRKERGPRAAPACISPSPCLPLRSTDTDAQHPPRSACRAPLAFEGPRPARRVAVCARTFRVMSFSE